MICPLQTAGLPANAVPLAVGLVQLPFEKNRDARKVGGVMLKACLRHNGSKVVMSHVVRHGVLMLEACLRHDCRIRIRNNKKRGTCRPVPCFEIQPKRRWNWPRGVLCRRTAAARTLPFPLTLLPQDLPIAYHTPLRNVTRTCRVHLRFVPAPSIRSDSPGFVPPSGWAQTPVLTGPPNSNGKAAWPA